MNSGRSPTWAVMAFSFVNSLGTFVVTSGVYDLTDQTYGFTKVENYALGLVQGLTYILGAAGAHHAVLAFKRVHPRVSSRAILGAVMVAMALLAVLPWTALRFAPAGGGRPASWPIWVTVALYSPLTGILWPMAESFVSGGLRGEALRATVGWWNVVWSSALIVASVGIAPLVKERGADAIVGLAPLHMLGAALLLAHRPEPGEHLQEHHEHPAVYRRLLVTFRLLLPVSYLVSSALLPYRPTILRELGVPAQLFTVYGAAWLMARTLLFFVLQRWSAWHGRWWLAITGPTLLLCGFGVTVLSSTLGSGADGLGLLVGGLGMFGLGMASVYTGAIYYAMEVGDAEVNAGGTHEALIGVGYTSGPLLGLLGQAAVGGGVLAERHFEPALLAGVAGVALVVCLVVVRRVVTQGLRAAKSP